MSSDNRIDLCSAFIINGVFNLTINITFVVKRTIRARDSNDDQPAPTETCYVRVYLYRMN